jgi:hypothetical protein
MRWILNKYAFFEVEQALHVPLRKSARNPITTAFVLAFHFENGKCDGRGYIGSF